MVTAYDIIGLEGCLALLGMLALCLVWVSVFTNAVRMVKLAPADIIIERAIHTSQVTRKPIFVLFDASWSQSCRRFEELISHPEFKELFEANYVLVKFQVMEPVEIRKRLEHPGTGQLLAKWGGLNAGLPFYVILNDNRRVIADSKAMPSGINIGCPGTPEEIAAFKALLMQSAPRLQEVQVERFVEFLRLNAVSQ
jgi:hypothetical protein